MQQQFSLALGATLLSAGASAQDEAWFQESATELGVNWVHQTGAPEGRGLEWRDESNQPVGRYWFPEIMGGGVGLIDYDNDGDLDLYLVQSGMIQPEGDDVPPGNALFRNDGGTFVDVSKAAGAGDTGYGMGIACGDYDQDGDVDIYVTNVGGNVLLSNDGRGKFKDATKRLKAQGTHLWGTSAAFLDANMDGMLDLFVVNNLNWEPTIETDCVNYRKQPDYCSPENYNAHSTDTLFLLGRLGFGDAAPRIGLSGMPANGLGVCVADYDRDGDMDVYVANDATPNALWRNDGGKRLGKSDGLMTNVAPSSGCAVNIQGTPEAGMGVQWVDLNQDGWLDLYMTHLRKETNTLYLNNGKGRFLDKTRMTGVQHESLKYTGFGVGFHDFDHDGILDKYVANGAVQAWGKDEAFDPEDPYAEPNQLFRGKERMKFSYLGEGTTAPMIGNSRGAAFGDIDNDGDVDIVVVDQDANVRVLMNIAEKKGSFLGVRLLNKKGADALGAMVRLTTTKEDGSERVQWRLAHPAYSYLSSNDPRVHFGVPTGDTITDLSVIWPGDTELTSLNTTDEEGNSIPPSAGSYVTYSSK